MHEDGQDASRDDAGRDPGDHRLSDRPSGAGAAGIVLPPSPADADRATLEAEWLALTRAILPALAAGRRWPVRADHCFQRILLDHAVGGCWYAAVARRPAYRHIAIETLRTAVRLGQAVAAGDADLADLNHRSLAWRGKRH